MVIDRGDIWWADLPDAIGSQPGYRRPILIIQSNDFNQSRIATIIGVVITSNIRLAKAPGNVYLSKKISGLSKDSVVNVSQVITIDKNFLTDKVTTLPSILMTQIEIGLRLVLSL